MTFRIVVFTAGLGHNVLRTIDLVLREHADVEVMIFHHTPVKTPEKLLKNQIKNVERHGWRWIPYQAGKLVKDLTAPAPRASRMVGVTSSLAAITAHPRVTLRRYPSINSPQAIAELVEWKPDLGLVMAAPILKKDLFEVPRLGSLNLHKGKLPEYRGMPPAFWEIWNGESSVGVTVHKVAAGLDTGEILLEDSVPLEKFATPGVRVRLGERGSKMMLEAVGLMRSGAAVFKPQVGKGETRTRPTLAQERELEKRVRPDKHDLKRRAKSAFFSGWAPAKELLPESSRRLVILLYHRVSDELRDSVTIGVEQFEEHMRYLAASHHLVTMEDIIADRPLPKDGPLVAVTFDDGYRDNYINAAPVLLKHGVHSTFFISTDKVGKNEPFDHDLKKLGRGLPNMSWNEVREMHVEGFSFGSHTANHVNMAKATDELAAIELERSRTALQTELGIAKPMFAYPFGKRADMTPARLEQVKQAGYACNCSAYGGVNELGVDRWDIRRQGVDHTMDPAALRAKIAGWKHDRYV